MADRHAIYNRHQMASRVGTGAFPRTARVAANASSNNSGASTASASASVRRNLFQSQLTRRPTQAASVGSVSAAPSLDGTERDIGAHMSSGPAEIVVRDRNGEVELVDPPSPTADEMGEMALDARQESERERQRLADTIKYHQQRTSIPGQPEELLDALRASLRQKVSALAEDNWMYEPEEMPRND
ncbi:hypothetical protein SCUCBS95973_008925 [Sporothrix curviconia]|uniref:Uncharacterized protein n=1 Tax=Sporothrix curviconia TaxID=1260050 RepID=A0ABP0CSX2_9PEZI